MGGGGSRGRCREAREDQARRPVGVATEAVTSRAVDPLHPADAVRALLVLPPAQVRLAEARSLPGGRQVTVVLTVGGWLVFAFALYVCAVNLPRPR